MDSLYSEIILDLYHHPLHKKPLADFDFRNKRSNVSCSDKVEIFLKFDKTGTVVDVGWAGQGCTVSEVSASLLTDYLLGKSKKSIASIKPAKILQLLGIKELNPARLRCALLPLEALKTE